MTLVVNTQKNKDILSQIPHKNKEDLSLIYKVLVNAHEHGTTTVTIRNEFLSYWEVSTEQIHELAMANSKEIFPATIRTVTNIMREMLARTGIPEELLKDYFRDLPAEKEMYVISNKSITNGAFAMFYEGILPNLCEKVGSDIYIIPSSIHEVIVISTSLGTPRDLRRMVCEINGIAVPEDEQLSDNVYLFERATKKFSVA